MSMEAARILEQEYSETQVPALKLLDNPEKAEKVKSRRAYAVCKRMFDVTMSLIALVVLSPVFLVTAVAIYVEDGGPVVFRQERIGKGENPFSIYKFRSMKKDADKIHEQLRSQFQNEEVSFKLKDDPRVTRVGKIIRKTNIDELPQLLNIIKGEMSIVGPRPLPVYEYEEERQRYGQEFVKRYTVPQGLTCIWQVSNRGNVEFEERMQMDVAYAEKKSSWMDLKLILLTIKSILLGKAGY